MGTLSIDFKALDELYNKAQNNGVVQENAVGIEEVSRERITKALNNTGLSIEECLGNLSRISKHAEKEETQLNAVKTALEIHGVLKPKAGLENGNQVIIKIDGINNERVSAMLNPQRSQNVIDI
jgi:hypothetical protein